MRASGSTPIATVDRAVPVLDRVVEEGPQHLVELVAIGDGEPVGGVVDERDRPVRGGQRVPGPLDPRPDGEDVGGRPGRLGFEPADEQQLLDHPGQPIRLVGDDGQRRVRLGSVAAIASAFDLIEVNGVWRLWLTPRRKSSLTSLSWRSWTFFSWTWVNSSALRMATPISLAYRSNRAWSARSQGWVAGRLARMRPIRSSPARSSARTGSETPGMRSSASTLSGSTKRSSAEMNPNAVSRVARRALGERLHAVARLGRLDRGEDQPELAVAPLGVAGQAVVALGQLGQDVAALDRDRLAQVARGDALDRGRDLAQGPDQVEADRGAGEDADARPRRRT